MDQMPLAQPSSLLFAEQLLEDKVALAVIGRLGDDEDDYESAGFQVTCLTRYPFVLVAPEGHPLLTRKRVSVKDVVKEPLVVIQTSRYAKSWRAGRGYPSFHPPPDGPTT